VFSPKRDYGILGEPFVSKSLWLQDSQRKWFCEYRPKFFWRNFSTQLRWKWAQSQVIKKN